MKKLISLILAVVMIFSVTAMAVSAADEATKPVKVTFIYDKADLKGIPVPATEVIYVDYGENYTKKAPKSTYIAAGWKYEIVGWTTTDVGPADRVWVNLPTIAEGDGVKEITFHAEMGAKEVTPDGVVEDAVEDVVDNLFGESTMAFINYIIEQIKVWFGKLLLLFGSMM